MAKDKKFVWIDLEMTGLNPETDQILEIALVITDNNLNVLHEGTEFVINQSDYMLNTMNPWCIEHHGKSGLTNAVRASQITVEYAQMQILEIIKQHCDKYEGVLAGNTIWQDRAFLARYMPSIINYLHYRLLDVTSVKELISSWYKDDVQMKFKKAESHRALADVYESIAELAHYRNLFFK